MLATRHYIIVNRNVIPNYALIQIYVKPNINLCNKLVVIVTYASYGSLYDWGFKFVLCKELSARNRVFLKCFVV